MQTFLHYPMSFYQCALTLDWRRLGKQRVEALQILKALYDPQSGWRFHAAVEMWRGHEPALMLYHDTMITEWIKRGYKNNMPLFRPQNVIMPPWLSHPSLAYTHRGNLLRKDPSHYKQFGWTEPPQTIYWWPYNRREGRWIKNF